MKISARLGTVRKAVANALVLTGAWSAAVVDSKPAGVTGKEWSALLVIWIGVAVVYLTGNDSAPGTMLVQGVVSEFDAPLLGPRVLAPGETLAEGEHIGPAVAVSGHGSADDGVDAQAAGAPPQ